MYKSSAPRNALVCIEILTFEGCPNALGAEEAVHQAVLLEGVEATIDTINVDTAEAAMQIRFLGSPTVRINGVDVDPASRHTVDCGLMCRTYRYGDEVLGAPSLEMIRQSIRQASREVPG